MYACRTGSTMLSKALTVLLVVYFTSDFSFAIQKDYENVNGLPNVYKFYATKKNWHDAKQVCAEEGASLFYPKDKNEVTAAISFWKLHESQIDTNTIWIFVGISDIKTEGVFETIDGKSISEVYHGWYYPQPDNSGNEDCVHLNQDGVLNDIKCDAVYSFICEKKQSPEQNQSIRLPTSVAIQKDYENVNGLPNVYKFYATKKNWHDAKQVCAEEGASLFYPKDKNEVTAAISFWKLHESQIDTNKIWIFVGISDIKTEGVFETIDGKSISEVYHGWYYPQPDNSGNEDCVHLNQDGELNDIKCDAVYSFICEKKLSPELNQSIRLSTSVAIQKDYENVNGLPNVYKFYATKKNWHDAKQVCAEEGASLFYPKDKNEVTAAISFWKLHEPQIHTNKIWIFVGISDIKTEGVFETIDGKSISEVYHGWYYPQPDNSGNEDCVHLNQDGELNDIKCDAVYSFICEKKLSPTQIIEGEQKAEDEQKVEDKQKVEDEQQTNKFFRKDYNYIEAVESFYKIHTIGHPLDEAKRVCALEGATFWHPANEDEAHAVISFWNATQPHIGWVYVGQSDMISNKLAKSFYEESVSEDYNNSWRAYESDNQDENQNCVRMNKTGDVDYYECVYNNSFICKKTLQSLEWNKQCKKSYIDYTFDEDTGKCYKLHTTPLNWTEAYAECRREQSHLAVISNQLVADYLADLTQTTPNPRVEENYQRGIYHVGFHNRFNEGWQTVKGTAMDVDADMWWDSYKPAHDRAQCGSMFYTGRLVNTDCAMKSFFICEHDIDSS